MKCPYCGHEMGELPVDAIRASMRGPKMLQIFDRILEAGDRGVSLGTLVKELYTSTGTDNYNAVKVTMIRLKERVAKYGWIIESGTAQDSAIERVYRIRREQP